MLVRSNAGATPLNELTFIPTTYTKPLKHVKYIDILKAT